MRLALALIAALGLSGCATYNLPPNSEVSTDRTEIIEGSMGVIVGRVVVEDEGGVRAHLGEGAAPEVYRAFLAETLPDELLEQSTLSEAFVGEAEGFNPLIQPEPANGATLVVNGETPDWVLILKSVTLYRARYSMGPAFPPTPGQPAPPNQERRAVRNDIEIVLWSNELGGAVARGEVQSEETLSLAPSRRTYEGAVSEIAEKLIENVPLRRRRG